MNINKKVLRSFFAIALIMQFLILTVNVHAAGENWSTGWEYRKKITIDNTKIDENLSDFTVLVKLTDTNFDFTKARSDGYDIRFTSSDGDTLLSYERERHDDGNELGEYWVKIPSITSDADTEFYMYYGKSDATDGQDATNAWDSNLVARYDMADITTSTIEDSTSNNNDGTKHAANEPVEADGKVVKSQSFDGTDDKITVSDSNSLDLTSQGSIMAWVKITSYQNFGGIIHKGHQDNFSDEAYFLQFGGPVADLGNNKKLVGGGHNEVENEFIVSDTELNLDTWYFATYTWDNSSQKLYIDSVLDKSSLTVLNARSTAGNVQMGAQVDDDYYFNGLIDEIRLANTARSATWIKAEYNSMSDTLLSYEAEETTYTLTYTAGANGSITGDSPQTVIQGEDGTAVTAVANANYHFVDWSDASTDNPRTDTNVSGDVTVTANFAIDTHTLTYTAGANGSVTGTSPQTVDHGGDGTAVTAVADSGYHFVNWSDASTENSRTDTGVTADITVTANFEADVVASNGGGGVPLVLTNSHRSSKTEEKGEAIDEERSASSSTDENATGVEESEYPFTDIEGNGAQEHIIKLYELGYVDGYKDKTFNPEGKILRAEAAKMIALWMDASAMESKCEKEYYSDVKCTDWFGKYISYLTERGVLHGYGGGFFRPEKEITTVEALKMIIYAKGLQDTSIEGVTNPFTWMESGDWYYNVVIIGYNNSMLSSYGEELDPNGAITRAQFTKLFSETLI